MEAEKIGTILDVPGNTSDSRCENCGYGLRHKDKTGLRKWCKRCIDVYERKQHLTAELVEKRIFKEVGALYLDATLDDLSPDVREKLLNLKHGQDVFMYGPVGTGKTHTMAAMLKHFTYEGYDCERINFDDFCVQVRSTMSPASTQTEWDLIQPLKEIDKLFIDDLGLRSKVETDFSYVTLYSILNKRQERRLPTFVSTNKSIQQLAQTFDARIASRLSAAVVIEMVGQDRRRAVKKSQ